MKNKKLLAFCAILSFFVFFNQKFYSQNTESQKSENSLQSSSTAFDISTDPSQIQLTDSSPTNPASQKEPSTIWLFVRMIFALAIVAAFAYGIFYFMKRNVKNANDNDPFLRKVSQITLSPGKSVQIITLQESAYLIGVSDQNINLIGKIDDKELVNAMNLYADKNERVKKPKSFSEILEIFMPQNKKTDESIYSANSNMTSQSIKDSLKKLNEE
ncbi:FliO/MopB family protein [Treponema pectinovorum]|uniref:FliO/MopB family protein n=1 Tax=Treponema pectinovorum TaxID=164 RepID=UPI0011C7AB0B|nr:flagellar biosynthetic protein FliO [Treponema pectinovorum]